MTYATNTALGKRRLIDATGVLIFAAIMGTTISFVLINWITGCGERFQHMDGTYTQGECVTPLDLFNNHRDNQTALEDIT